ncbi:MAG: hypothetical protein IAE98_11815, partial [Candidatus Kapabacteria bacterium]|nr:hypothetical protein [Candidatus Kapabacteria bacterium]
VSNLLTQYAEYGNMTANESTLTFAYIGDEIRQKIDEIIDLYNLLGHLKSFTAYMNNRLMYNLDFVNLKKIFECHHSRPCKRQSFGCQYLDSVKLYQSSPNGPFWFEYGHLESADVWIIDKSQIMKVLEKEIKQNLIYFCPQFSLEHIKSVIAKLPDKLTLSKYPELELYQRDRVAVTGEPTKWELRFKSNKEEILQMMDVLEQKIMLLQFIDRLN